MVLFRPVERSWLEEAMAPEMGGWEGCGRKKFGVGDRMEMMIAR